MVSRDWSGSLPSCQVYASVLQAGDIGKCLGYWWIEGDLVATKSVRVRGNSLACGSIGCSRVISVPFVVLLCDFCIAMNIELRMHG